MYKYMFYDTDFYGKEEYDIKGSDYVRLLSTCIKYSKSFSCFIFDTEIVLPEFLEKYKMPLNKTVIDVYRRYFSNFEDPLDRIFYLSLSPEVCSWIYSVTDRIFAWAFHEKPSCPDDPTFYREDGSIFFTSEIHEGYCTIFPRDNEDVNDIISVGIWDKVNDNDTPFFCTVT